MPEASNFETLIAVDNDKYAVDTFKNNMPYADVIIGDITDDSIKKEIIEKSRTFGINMIIGGPPCQGYSMKGKKLGLEDPRNFLFREYLNLVEQLKPDVFVIENVKGLLLSSNGWFKNEIISTITNLGYSVEYGVLNAADFGVPQARERAIFICSRHNRVTLPNSSTSKIVTVRDAIGDLSYLNSGEGAFEQEYSLNASSDYQEQM